MLFRKKKKNKFLFFAITRVRFKNLKNVRYKFEKFKF